MTTTDLARMESNAVAVLTSSSDALDRLGRWVEAASQAHQLVAPLINTAFVPDGYRPKVDPRATDKQKADAEAIAVANATAAVLQGITLGIDPLTALAQIYIVHGRPGLYTKMMVALVQSHGHEVWDEDITDTRAVVAGRRKGSEHIVRVTITMDQARKAGWTSNQAYTKTPQDMLWSRAAARVCDRIASDVLKGIASVEEIQDSIKTTAEAGGTRTVSRRRAAPALDAAVVEDPPLDEEPGDPAPAEPTPAEPAKRKLSKLHSLLRDKDKADRDVALVYIAGVIGREIGSTKELTVAEEAKVIAQLEAEPGDSDTPAQPAFDDDAHQPGGDP